MEQRAQDLIDQSRLLTKRSQRLTGQSWERVRRQHQWLNIALGRVCYTCRCAQYRDEFSDDEDCRRAI